MAIFGNDISSYQGEPIDFVKMKSAGCQFVYIRAGVGWTKDRFFDQNKKGAREAGIPWGSYWVPWPTQTTGKLLENYAWMQGGDWGDLPPCIDVETDGLGLSLFIYWLNFTEPLWISRVGLDIPVIRKKLVFYTRASHFNGYDNPAYKKELGRRTNLWVAHYTYSPDKKPTIPRDSWTDYLIHQYSADENSLGANYGVKSKAIDMNYFNGQAIDFLEWSGVIAGEPGEPPPLPPPAQKYVRVKVNWLRFRSKPSLYAGDTLCVGRGMQLKVTGMIRTDIEYYMVEADGFEGFISANAAYSEPVR